jgi:hypothetical protein
VVVSGVTRGVFVLRVVRHLEPRFLVSRLLATAWPTRRRIARNTTADPLRDCDYVRETLISALCAGLYAFFTYPYPS